MSHTQRFGFGKVCDSERDFEDAMVGPGREPEAGDGLVDAVADGSRRLASRLVNQLLDLDRRHLNVHVDPVQKRPGQPAAITLHLKRTAGAGTNTIAEKAAGASVCYLLQKNSGI